MSKKPVLLVEGNPDHELLALHALKKNGLEDEEIVVARDGAQALEYLFGARTGRKAGGLPCLVLLDQRLPRVDGPEVLRRLRENDRTAPLPVVVLTADDLPDTPADRVASLAFLRKPLTPKKLAEAARKLGVGGLLSEEAPREKRPVTSGPTRAVPRGAEPLRALLVEGSEDDASLVLRALRRGGHEPLHRRVETRAAMEAALAEEGWDIVLSDYRLPGFGAVEALDITKESGLDLPFIVASSKIGEDAAVELMRAGAHDFVAKTNLSRLAPAVEREVREARGRRERRRAEAMLRESEHRFRTLVQNSSEVTVVLDARGTILYESPAVERVLGFLPEERVGRELFELVHPDDLGRVHGALARFLEEPGVRSPVGYRARHKDGSWRHLEAVGKNLLSDPIVKGVVVNFHDVTDRKKGQEELERRARLLDLKPDAILVRDLQNRITFWNRGAEELYGWKSEEALGRVSHELLKTRFPVSLEQATSELIRDGKWEGELHHTKRDDTTVVTASRWALQRDERGEPTGVFENNGDITERKRAEEELKQSEERFRLLAENAKDIIYRYRFKSTPGFEYVSPSATALTGYTPEEHYADPELGLKLVYPDDRQVLEAFLRSPEPADRFLTLRWISKDGRVIWIEQQISSFYDDQGELVAIEGIGRDITERKKMEEELRRSEERFRSLIQNASDIVTVLEADGTVRYVSPAIERILGYAPGERVGSNTFDLIHPDDREKAMGVLAEAVKSGESTTVELRFSRKDGSWCHLEAVGCSLLENSSVGGLVVNSRDITDRKRAEEALRQGEAKTRAVLDAIPDLMFRTSRTGEFLDFHAKDQSKLYASAEALVGSNVRTTLPPEIADEALRHIARALDTGDLQIYEYQLPMPEGVRDYEARIVASGPDEVLCIARDTTERKRAEEELRRSEERFRSLIQNASDIVTVLEADGTVRYESPAIERVLGYRPEELVGKNALDYVHPDDQEYLQGAFREKIRGSQSVQMEVEFRLRHADGSWRHLKAVVTNLLEDPSVAGIVANSRDVTERKRAEESMRRSFGMLLALLEGNRILTSTLEAEEIGSQLLELMRGVSGLTAVVINVKDEQGRFRIWRSTGLDKLWPRSRYSPEAEAARRAVLETGEPQLFGLRRPAPKTGHLVGLCLPLRVQEHTSGVLEAYGPEALKKEDVIEILMSLASQAASALDKAWLYGELAEREKRLESLIGKVFVAQEEERQRVAYEVHDGLAQVAVAAHQHLQAFARFYPPDCEEGWEILHRALDLVQRTVADARRIIANLRPTALDDFGLATAVRLEVEALSAEGWRIDFEGNLSDDERLPFAVETALFRVIQEALTNIRKHANTKHVRLSLEHLGQSVRLSVQDWGRGFDPAALTNNGGPGERIGLSSMRERITLIGGDFRICSRPGSGTSITVEVPLPKQSEADRERDDVG